ncbi:MAG: hypothetical protein KDN22_07070 [Verrucomicrobiae bacterium]|nr:hypothetical protein [Verrucomicrobiae bacterium]
MNEQEPISPGTRTCFPPIAAGNEEACRALWLSVLLQQVTDATSQSGKRKNRRYRVRATAWLADLDGSPDFDNVCDLAGLDATVMRKKIKAMLHDPQRKPDFRVLRKGRRKRCREQAA